ncbi:MAG: hypothetical protein IJU51_00875 [Clostridia bacterium]|nr:hypothetical protein [Clostridia bacterium]
MTSKELLYVEDALGHEKYFRTQCCETISRLQDEQLKTFVQQLEQSHSTIFQSLYGLL